MKKNVLLLDAGVMGTMAAQTLAGSDEVGRLILADRDRARLEEAAQKCPANVAIETIDVTDTARLVALMRRADVVMSIRAQFRKTNRRPQRKQRKNVLAVLHSSYPQNPVSGS